jgi:hypothetical protein
MNTTTLPRHARTGATAVGWRKARPGESDPQPIWPILGAAEDEGADGSEEGDGEEETGEGAGDGSSREEGTGGEEQLGEAGVQALAREKGRRKAEAEKRRRAEARVAELEAEKTGTGEAANAEQIRAEADKAATARANQRIVRSEVRAAAAGKLADPKDALTFLDLAKFEVDEDGQVDEEEIADAIADLIKNKPYLAAAATATARFQGAGDGGARKGSSGPVQFTEAQVKKMTPEQIDEAHRKGQLRDYMGG